MAYLIKEIAFEITVHGDALTHPATLIDGYTAIADLRATPIESLRQQVARNFERYFLN